MNSPALAAQIQKLCDDDQDSLVQVWRHINSTFNEHGAEKALLQIVATLRAQRDGACAREGRLFDSCPYPPFEGEPATSSDLLHLAWMSGYNARDMEIRCTQAERNIYDAFKALGELREYTDHKKDIGISSQEEFAKRLRYIHGTILTSTVKQRVIDEEREAQQVLELFKEEERRRRL